MTTASRLIATPMECLGHVLVEAPSVTGRLLRVRVERWSTDLLDCEVWCVLDAGHQPSVREWFTTPGVACEAAGRRFGVAGYSSAPVPSGALVRGPIRPRGWLRADEVRGRGVR